MDPENVYCNENKIISESVRKSSSNASVVEKQCVIEIQTVLSKGKTELSTKVPGVPFLGCPSCRSVPTFVR